MVAQITDGTAFDKHGRPFRRRRLLPGLVMFAAMAVAALLVWVIALSRPPDVREAAVCNPPPPAEPGAPAPDLGEQAMQNMHAVSFARDRVHRLCRCAGGLQQSREHRLCRRTVVADVGVKRARMQLTLASALLICVPVLVLKRVHE